MPNETVQVRITAELKKQAEDIFKGMGLKTSEAIRLFLQQAVNIGGLPFQPMTKQPSKSTQEAMKEIDKGDGESFKNSKELFNSWKEK
jgi:DNA-damage-inducible protein J